MYLAGIVGRYPHVLGRHCGQVSTCIGQALWAGIHMHCAGIVGRYPHVLGRYPFLKETSSDLVSSSLCLFQLTNREGDGSKSRTKNITKWWCRRRRRSSRFEIILVGLSEFKPSSFECPFSSKINQGYGRLLPNHKVDN